MKKITHCLIFALSIYSIIASENNKFNNGNKAESLIDSLEVLESVELNCPPIHWKGAWSKLTITKVNGQNYLFDDTTKVFETQLTSFEDSELIFKPIPNSIVFTEIQEISVFLNDQNKADLSFISTTGVETSYPNCNLN